MHDFFQTHNVVVVSQLLKNRNLTNSCAWDAVVTMINLDFFDCYSAAGGDFQGLVDHTVGTLSQLRLIFKLTIELIRCREGPIVGIFSAFGRRLRSLLLLGFISGRLSVNLRSCGWKLLLDGHSGLGGLDWQFTLDHGYIFSLLDHHLSCIELLSLLIIITVRFKYFYFDEIIKALLKILKFANN